MPGIRRLSFLLFVAILWVATPARADEPGIIAVGLRGVAVSPAGPAARSDAIDVSRPPRRTAPAECCIGRLAEPSVARGGPRWDAPPSAMAAAAPGCAAEHELTWTKPGGAGPRPI